ncbi:MAG: ATP synthase F1 subunit delta [Chitinophagia bacterium]|jgi:F-type H+-transporting ATPase subunit delta
MANARLAGRYAKSLLDLATEQGQLEAVYADMKYLHAVCQASSELVNVLRSPIIKADQKNSILAEVFKNKVGLLSNSFMVLLVKKGRESELPEMAAAFIQQYNAIKGIHQVTLTTAVEVSDVLKKSIEAKVKAETSFATVELTTKTDENLIGGFVLEFNNNLVDASIARDLKDIKRQFISNEFIGKIK